MNETADNKSYYDAFRATAGRVPDNTALIFLGSSISYSRLLYYVENMAGGLHAIGVRKGERAIMYLPNGPQWIITWLALLRLNAVPVPVTPIYTSADLSYIVRQCSIGLIDR